MVNAPFRRFMPWLVALAIFAGGAVLGVLQVRWVGEASRAEESRIRASLNRGSEQVRTQSEDEIRVLLSMARVSPTAIAAGDWTGLTESLQLWYANTRFPGLLRGLYIVRQLPSGSVLAWSKDAGAFVEVDLPSELAEAIPDALAAAQSPGSWPTASLADWRRVVVVPVYGSRHGGAAAQPTGAVVVDLDARVFYGDVVPFSMKRNLSEFPWRIVDAADGTTVGESAGLAAKWKPEVVVGLRSLAVADNGGRDTPQPAPDGSATSLLDPLLQSWLQRAQGSTDAAAAPPEPETNAGTEAYLQVFYPGGTLAGTVRARQALSLALSLGLIGILLASLAVLSRLYRRSARLRASEQEFVASVSHELRTPIAVIQATSENLQRGAVSDPARLPRYAEVIHTQVKRLAGMVESILLYAGLESGMARRPSMAEVDLQGLVDEVVPPLQQLASERGSRLAVSTASLPSTACADRTALRLVIENLVTNAVRHAESGEIRLTVQRRPFDTLHLSVEDDGRGIPAREQGRIFDPFVRGERSVREQKPGSGLGLHLVRRVVGLLGGKVTLESPYRDIAGAERNGCRFTVELPCKERCDEA
jgi:signal transduction histidine kinase